MNNFVINLKNNKYLFIITLCYFFLGFININLALLALVCMAIPIILLLKNNKKTWCQGYCPRSNLYANIGKLKKWKHLKTPSFFIKGNMKWIMLLYFCLNIFIIVFSTIVVAKGKVEAMDYIRILFIIRFGSLPQLLTIKASSWLIHMSYRFYSMMLTTTTLGLILALIFKPRTWCVICPIATVSDSYIEKTKNKIKNIPI